MPTIDAMRATEATELGMLLAQVDLIADAHAAGAEIRSAQLAVLLSRRDSHRAAHTELIAAQAAEGAANAARVGDRIEIALRKGRGELEDV